MKESVTPSAAALMSAAARAAHQLIDGSPPVYVDTEAAALCEASGIPALQMQVSHASAPVLSYARVSALIRARHAEAEIIKSPSRQLIVLGAGLDTVAHHVPNTTWLVDMPGVLAWRNELFHAAGRADRGTPVGVDLAKEEPWSALESAGWDPGAPSFVSWIGVTMYLPQESIARTLKAMPRCPGSTVLFDHVLPPTERDEAGQQYAEAVSDAVAATESAWQTVLSADDAAELLGSTGWIAQKPRFEDELLTETDRETHSLLTPKRLIAFASGQRA